MVLMIEGWVALAVIVAAVAFYRRAVARHEDDTIHLTSPDTRVVSNQVEVAKQLNKIDLAGKVLTAALIVYSIAAVGRIIYLGWLDSAQMK